MQQQRKRFSYLTVQQRALNSSNVIDTDKTGQSKHGSVFSSNTKSRHIQELSLIQKQYKPFSRNSSINKAPQALSQLSQNPISSYIRTSATKNPTISNTQNLCIRQSNKSDQKPSFSLTSRHANNQNLQTRVKQLQQQNSLILRQTQEKFVQMETHLERVEGILKQKQTTIEKLVDQNLSLKEKCRSLEVGNGQLSEQKEELIKIINQKNLQIKKLTTQRQTTTQRQSQILAQLNTSALQSQLSTLHPSIMRSHTLHSPCQTDLISSDIDNLISKSRQAEGTDKLNYRQKYEALFKRALEMEDQMYKLKEELFDSQNEVKAVQQEFNTYKIFNQIQKINAHN